MFRKRRDIILPSQLLACLLSLLSCLNTSAASGRYSASPLLPPPDSSLFREDYGLQYFELFRASELQQNRQNGVKDLNNDVKNDVEQNLFRGDYSIQYFELFQADEDYASADGLSGHGSAARSPLFAVKTNLLFDLATVLNYAVEVPVGNHFSLQFQHNTPWWLTRNRHYCLQARTFSGELRYWFGKNRDERLRGHFVGLSAIHGSSDLQFGRKLCYQSRINTLNLGYGFSFPLGKKANLEFCLAFGYGMIPYQHYIPSDDFSVLYRDYEDAGTLQYLGPTKLEVSLVLPIRPKSRDNNNDRRAGR